MSRVMFILDSYYLIRFIPEILIPFGQKHYNKNLISITECLYYRKIVTCYMTIMHIYEKIYVLL